jgi:hypothetical protein
MSSADWHWVAEGAVTILVLVLGWIWTSSSKRSTDNFKSLFEKVDTHILDDSNKFASVLAKMNEYHIETINRISGRWNDTPKEG